MQVAHDLAETEDWMWRRVVVINTMRYSNYAVSDLNRDDVWKPTREITKKPNV